MSFFASLNLNSTDNAAIQFATWLVFRTGLHYHSNLFIMLFTKPFIYFGQDRCGCQQSLNSGFVTQKHENAIGSVPWCCHLLAPLERKSRAYNWSKLQKSIFTRDDILPLLSHKIFYQQSLLFHFKFSSVHGISDHIKLVICPCFPTYLSFLLPPLSVSALLSLYLIYLFLSHISLGFLPSQFLVEVFS